MILNENMIKFIIKPLDNLSASVFLLAPPIISPNVCVWCCINSLKTPKVCIDNSLVGDTMITPVPINKFEKKMKNKFP